MRPWPKKKKREMSQRIEGVMRLSGLPLTV